MSVNIRSDERFIKLALELAKRGVGQTGSNPSVGCIIVKGNKIVGRGATGQQGYPHAETIAMKQAGELCAGATMFVTLEPCAHHGKTPPCVEKVIKSKIIRVVCPLIDPDLRVSGAGFKMLKKANIKLDFIPFAQAWAKEVVRGFLSRKIRGHPFITVKLGMSIDGKIASKTGKSQWITNKYLRTRSHLLRVRNDAILVGTNTFLHDNPKLNARGALKDFFSPLRLFLDRDLKIFPSKSILMNVTEHPSIIVCGENPNITNLKKWEEANVEILKVTSTLNKINLVKLFEILGQRGINSVLVEGGGKLLKSLLEDDLIDELIVHRSGVIIGSDGIPSVFELEKNSYEIDNCPKMILHTVQKWSDNTETIWRRQKEFF